MTWAMWIVVERDIQLMLMALLMAPIFYFSTSNSYQAVMATMICVVTAAFLSYWDPSLAAVVLLPLIPWSILGILMGTVIDGTFDHPMHPPENQGHAPLPAKSATVVFGITGSIVGIAVAHIINMAVSPSALGITLWLTQVAVALLFVVIAMLEGKHRDRRNAWFTVGAIHVAGMISITLILHIVGGIFWPILMLVLFLIIALIGVYFLGMIVSKDVAHALRTMSEAITPVGEDKHTDTMFADVDPSPSLNLPPLQTGEKKFNASNFY